MEGLQPSVYTSRFTQRESAAEGRERTTTRSARQLSMQTASVQSQLALRTHVHISHRVVSQNRKRPFQHTCGAVQAPLQTCAVQCIEYMRRRESDRAVACVGSTRGSSDSPTVLYVRARPFRHAALRPHPTHPPKGWPLRRREGLSRRSDLLRGGGASERLGNVLNSIRHGHGEARACLSHT